MSRGLAGQVALVTGAAQGIGQAIVRSLSNTRVWATDLDGATLAPLAADTGAEVAVVDVTDEDAVRVLVGRILAAEGRIDILVHCAGGVRGQVGRPVEDVPAPDWHAVMDVNATGAFLSAKHVAPVMKRQGYGRIVTISSGAGLRPSLTGIQAYTAAKHALVGLTKQLAQELGPHGITVNSVAPGLVLSNPSTVRQWERYASADQTRIVQSVFTRRLGTPQDIAWAVAFLAAPESGWISGQVLSVDGGRA